MNSLITLTSQQLRKAADLKEKIDVLQDQLSQLLGTPAQSGTPDATAAPKAGRRKKWKLSPEGVANIRAGVARRMAKKAVAMSADSGEKPKKRKMSAAGRRSLSLKLKARWAARRAAGRTKL
jgi:hypothetical protein